MKRMKILLAVLVLTFAYACGQKADDTFDKKIYFNQPVYLNGGFYLNGIFYATIPTGIGSMVYPAAGIPLSNGTAWGTSIVNNSANWNTAFGWGNHAGLYSLLNHNHSTLYKPIGYIPTWAEITAKPTFATVATSGSYVDLLNKPAEVELGTAISQMPGIDFPVLTQTQINALTPPKGRVVINSTLNCLQWYDGTGWKIFATVN